MSAFPRLALTLACVFLLPSLAGCVGPPGPEDPTGPDTFPASTYHDAVLPVMKGWEPSIAAGPDGTLYVVAPSASAPRANHVWRSDDEGLTWQHLGDVAAEYGTNDATITVRPDGSVWIGTYWARRVPPGLSAPICTAVSVSTDRGETWSTNGLGCGNPTYDERPWLTSSADRTFLLHPCAFIAGVCLSVSEDNSIWINRPLPIPPGGTFSPPVYDEGRLGFAFTTPRQAPYGLGYEGPLFAWSEDDGLTWTIERVATEPVDGRFLQAAFSKGHGVVAWMAFRGDGEGSVIRGARSLDGAWGPPVDLSTSGTAALPWAAAENGETAVAWLATEERGHPHAIGEDAHWYVEVWHRGSVHRIPQAMHEGCLGSSYDLSVLCQGSNRSPLGDFFSIDLLQDGRVAVAIGNGTAPDATFREVPLHVLVGP